MKSTSLFMIIFLMLLFSSNSCERKEDDQDLVVQNNSDQEIIIAFALYTTLEKDSICIKPNTKFEYEDFIRERTIKPHTKRGFSAMDVVNEQPPYDILYIGVFNRIDMDTMSCEEFKQKYPIKKLWKITKADAEVMNWMISYP